MTMRQLALDLARVVFELGRRGVVGTRLYVCTMRVFLGWETVVRRERAGEW